jgi:peptidoglycan/LPS O-acetylase OafA/YrhL
MAAFRLSESARVRRILRHPALLPALLAVTLLLLVIPGDDRLTVAAFVLLIMILGQQTSFGVRVFCNRFLLWVGGISYSVYLIHMPAAALMARLDAAVIRAIPAAWTAALPPTGIFLVDYLVLAAVVLPVAALTCRWIELPARRALRHVLDQRLPIPSLR